MYRPISGIYEIPSVLTAIGGLMLLSSIVVDGDGADGVGKIGILRQHRFGTQGLRGFWQEEMDRCADADHRTLQVRPRRLNKKLVSFGVCLGH